MRVTTYLSHLAWHAKHEPLDRRDPGIVAEMMIGVKPEDRSGYEFAIRWHRIGVATVPRIEMFDDAWAAFTDLPEFFARLNENLGNDVEDITELLRDLYGAEDVTAYTNPTAMRCPRCGSPRLVAEFNGTIVITGDDRSAQSDGTDGFVRLECEQCGLGLAQEDGETRLRRAYPVDQGTRIHTSGVLDETEKDMIERLYEVAEKLGRVGISRG